jgi:transcriptional regulator with XRE-family HTH domain
MQNTDEKREKTLWRDLGERVRSMRSKMEMSQGDLASEFGCAQSRISGIENGTRDPGVDFLAWFSEKAKVSIDFLVLGKVESETVNTFASAGDKFANKFFSDLKEEVADRLAEFVNSELSKGKYFGIDEIPATSTEKSMLLQFRYLLIDDQMELLDILNKFVERRRHADSTNRKK